MNTVLDNHIEKFQEFFPRWANEDSQFQFIPEYKEDNTITTLTQSERVFFHAISKYLQKGIFDVESFKQWMRVVWNIVENANINSIATMIGAIRLIDELGEHSHNIYEFLASKDSKIKSETAKEQVKEEIAKAKQILNGSPRDDGKSWEKIIRDAEKYAFFKGAIRFLFQDAEGNVTEESWGQFDKKWKNAQAYFKENPMPNKSALNETHDNAILLKALISRFTPDNYWKVLNWHYRVFNNYFTTWRYYLLNDNIKSPIHEIMMGGTDVIKKTISQSDEAETRLYQLSNTNLLDYVIEKIPASWIRDYHGHKAIFPSAEGVFLNADTRNYILLNTTGITLIDKYKVPNTNFLFGNNINFTYKEESFFQWYGNPNQTELDVYLMENDWANYKKRPNPTSDKGTDEDKYYCFRVTPRMEEDTSLFTEELDRLIKEVRKNEQ